MNVLRWGPEAARRPSALDEIAELDDVALLLLDGVRAGDDLPWARRAPCVVAAVGTGPAAADLVVAEGEADALADRVLANPSASRVLVDVLRTSEHLDVRGGLVVESLAYSMLMAGAEHLAWLEARKAPAAKAFDGEPVSLERSDGDLRITLARPANRNAFSAELRDALVDALRLASCDVGIDRVVVAAEGPVFSSGGDLAEFGSSADVVRAHEIRTLRSVGALIADLACRVEVHVQGACVGAGVELSAFAGTVVAAPGTTFRLPEVAMGLVPGAGGTVSIPRRIGRQRTARLALFGEALDLDRAVEWGLVDRMDGESGQVPGTCAE